MDPSLRWGLRSAENWESGISACRPLTVLAPRHERLLARAQNTGAQMIPSRLEML